MATLKELLNEITSQVPRRVNLTRVEVVLEQVASKLNESEQKKLADIYLDIKTMSEIFNATPYNIFNHDQWKLLEMVLRGKVAEFKLMVHDITEENKNVDCWPLANAIDTILI
jgi:hypothetical protein